MFCVKFHKRGISDSRDLDGVEIDFHPVWGKRVRHEVSLEKTKGLASEWILRGFIYRRSSVNRGVGVGEAQPGTPGPLAAGAVTTRAWRAECSLRAEGHGCIPAEKQQALVKGHDQPEVTSQREPRTKFPDLLPLFPLTSRQGSPQAWGPIHVDQTASWEPEMVDSEGELNTAETEGSMKEVAWGLRFKNE